jgi:hypothetical protein
MATGGRTAVSHLHIWYGRIIMALGIINGGLGLQLTNNTKTGKIVYAVIAGLVGVVYVLAVVLKRKVSGNAWAGQDKPEDGSEEGGARATAVRA